MTTKSSNTIDVPFNKSGDLMNYISGWCPPAYTTTMDKKNRFENQKLFFTGIDQGRSRMNLLFEDENMNRVNMFSKDAEEAIKHMFNGMLHCDYRIVKRGDNYGIELLKIYTVAGKEIEVRQ